MKIKKIAMRMVTEKMEAWDPLTETWVPDAFTARLDPTDRFLSNFNKPTRRRMLFADNECVFPESRTFRHPGTQDVYILGITRQDARGGTPYLGLTVCQLATDVPGGSSGLATITRREAVGPSNDPGWLVEREFAKAFIDLEFRTSANEPNATDLKIENYFAFLPINVQPKEWDFVNLHGVRYRVVDTFADSGFFGLRIDHENDFRSDFTLTVTQARKLDRATQQYTDEVTRVHQVTGVMSNLNDFPLWNTEADRYFDVYFQTEHLPDDLEYSTSRYQMWLEINGVKRQISKVSTQAGERQIQFRCK